MVEAQTHQQRQIDHILAGDEKPNDHSLAAKSWRRALNGEKPRTMAPDEWNAYFELTGQHLAQKRQQQPQKKPQTGPWLTRFWRTALSWLGLPQQAPNKPSAKNCVRLDMEDAEF